MTENEMNKEFTLQCCKEIDELINKALRSRNPKSWDKVAEHNCNCSSE